MNEVTPAEQGERGRSQPSPESWRERFLARLPLRWIFELFYLSSSDPWRYWRSSFERRRYDAARALIERHAPRPRRVLEVGCSVGAFTRVLLDIGSGHVTAVDISSVALRRARRGLARASERAADVELVCADLFADELPAGRFDLIVAMDVLGYTASLDVLSGLCARMRDRLSSDGLILLGNTRLRAQDGEGFEPFASGFPKLGARAILEAFSRGAQHVDALEDPKWRLDLLAYPQRDGG